MSSELYFRPVTPKPSGLSLPNEIKFVLRKQFGLRVGEPITLNGNSREYLLGLRDGGMDSVERLINAIDQYGEIELWEEP